MGWLLTILCHNSFDELGDGLINRLRLFFFIFLIFDVLLLFGNEKDTNANVVSTLRVEYYKYWNPYRRVLDLRGEPHEFYGQTYYMAIFNKDNRIKTVTKFGKDKKRKITYDIIWSRSGARSEYQVRFHENGNVSKLDPNLYSNQLSYMRSGWVAKFKSRSDGRPKEVSFSDSVGFEYFSYNFNYTVLKEDKLFSEVTESSYFDSEGIFVGRHLLFWEKGAFLKMIQYFNAENEIIETKEFNHDRNLEETVRVIKDKNGKELERKIIPYMPPDKYAYRYEWTGRDIIDRGLQDLQSLELALEFASRAEDALNKADEELQRAREALNEANERARTATKLMRKAEGQARDVELFKERMEKAKIEAQKAVEQLYDAEREAERARLEAASATATLDAIKKTKDIEDYAQDQAKEAKKEAKLARKEARKKARDAKRALQDSVLGTGPKSYLTLGYGQPFLIEETLEGHNAGITYSFSLGRRNLFKLDGKNIDVGLDINWFDFYSELEGQNFQTIGYFLTAQIDPRIAWSWVPSNLETGIKLGLGLVSPGYGLSLGGSTVFNLLPTPIIIGLTMQHNRVWGIIDETTNTHWTSIGLMFGVNLQDKIFEIFDIDLPDIFDIF